MRVSVQLEKMLISYINNNTEKNKDILQLNLLDYIKTWSNYSYYNSGLKVIDLNNKIHILKKRNKWDYSAYTYLEIDLKKLINKEKQAYILNSKVDYKRVFYSVIKSMTFSISDFYNDLTNVIRSKGNIQIIKVENSKEKVYDGTISINGIIFKDIKGAKNLVVVNQETLKKENIFIYAFNNLKVTEGMYLKKGEIIAEGTIYSALNNFVTMYWYRSRPFIGYTIFGFLLILLFYKRDKALKDQHIDEVKEIENELTTLENQIQRNIKEKEELLTTQNKIKEEYDSVCNKFKEYEDFVKFAFVDVTIDEMLEKNTRVLGTMFRLIAEKIVFSTYESYVGDIKYGDNLDKCLNKIKDIQPRVLSRESINSLYAVKQFGNQSSHYSVKVEEVSLAKTIIIAKDLVSVIDEYIQKNNLKE